MPLQRLILFFLLYCFRINNLSAAFSPSEIVQVLCKANAEIKGYGQIDVDESCYLLSGDSIFIVPQGRHYVFSYTKDRATFVRIDKSEFHGHNFGRKIFLYNTEIYAFGGYGFWQTHGKLLRFSRTTREWELVLLKGNPPTGMPALSYVKGDSLFAFYPVQKRPELNIDSVSRMGYIIDLRTKISSAFVFNNNRHFDLYRPACNDQQSRYAFFGYNGNVLHVIDKVDMRLYTSHAASNLYKGYARLRINALDSNFTIIVGNEILVYPKNQAPIVYPIADFLDLYCTFVSLSEQLQPIASGLDLSQNRMIWYIFFVALAVGLFIWIINKGVFHWRLSRKNRWNGVYQQMKHEPYYGDIRTLTPGIYSELEIDIALRIIHISKPLRRLKRSTYMEELNRMQVGFITRISTHGLRRKAQYEIGQLV